MSKYHHGNLRNAILAEAISLIGREGVEGVSLRQIAKALGVSHSAPARHFKSKADLLSAIVREAYIDLTKALLEDTDCVDDLNGVHHLNQMARRTIGWAVQNKVRFSAMNNPDVSRFADNELKAVMKDFTEVVSAALLEAQQQGFRKTASTESLLLYAIGATLGAATLLTDGLMQSVLEAQDKDNIISSLADQIIPIT